MITETICFFEEWPQVYGCSENNEACGHNGQNRVFKRQGKVESSRECRSEKRVSKKLGCSPHEIHGSGRERIRGVEARARVVVNCLRWLGPCEYQAGEERRPDIWSGNALLRNRARSLVVPENSDDGMCKPTRLRLPECFISFANPLRICQGQPFGRDLSPASSRCRNCHPTGMWGPRSIYASPVGMTAAQLRMLIR